MRSTPNDYPPMSRGSRAGWLLGIVLVLGIIITAIGACASREAPRKGYFAVCQTGGWIEGDSGTCGFRPTGSGKKMTGSVFSAWGNTLIEFPATNRFWWAQSETNNQGEYVRVHGADRAAQEMPVANGGRVALSYKLTMKLKQDQASAYALYSKHATRPYGTKSAADDPDQWFRDFLAVNVNPVVERINREEAAQYTCAQLNSSCDLDKLNALLDRLASDDEKKVADAQQERKEQADDSAGTLVTLSQRIEDRLAGPSDCKPTPQSGLRTCGELAKALEGEFFVDLDYNIIKADPPAKLVGEIDGANAALAGLVKTKAEARNKKEAASGETAANIEIARGKKALADAVSKEPAVAQIEMIKALCGVELVGDREVPKGCENLEVIGGNTSILRQAAK